MRELRRYGLVGVLAVLGIGLALLGLLAAVGWNLLPFIRALGSAWRGD
jgi:hypothetical protein